MDSMQRVLGKKSCGGLIQVQDDSHLAGLLMSQVLRTIGNARGWQHANLVYQSAHNRAKDRYGVSLNCSEQ